MNHSPEDRAGGGRTRIAAAALAAALVAGLAPPALASEFQAPDIAVAEGDEASFTIALPEAYWVNLRWAYATEDGTATAGEDYTAASGHVVFSAGTKTASVVVRTTRDELADDGETFRLKLSEFQTQGITAGDDRWTSAWRFEGIPAEKTIVATIEE